MARGLHADPSNLSWAINAYLLPLGSLILLGGGLGDRFGRRGLFLIGLLLFTLASILCAVVPTFAWFLAGRGMQGIGAALLMPNSHAILGGAFVGEERGRAIGSWAAAGAIAGAVGPIIGGWLIDAIGWRIIFIINIPVALAAGFLAWKIVAEQKEGAGAVRLDVVGAALATVALGLLTWFFDRSGKRAPLNRMGMGDDRRRRGAARHFSVAGTPVGRSGTHALLRVFLVILRGSDSVDLFSIWKSQRAAGFAAFPADTNASLVSDCGWSRAAAKAKLTRGEGQCGAATLIQRFGSALNLNVHFHMLVPDGLYLTETETPYFRRLGAPTREEAELGRVDRAARGTAVGTEGPVAA